MAKRRPEGYPTPYQRIVEAARAGRGVRLDASDVARIGLADTAVVTLAENDDADEERARAERTRERDEAQGKCDGHDSKDDWHDYHKEGE